jgi:hypothetical protein
MLIYLSFDHEDDAEFIVSLAVRKKLEDIGHVVVMASHFLEIAKLKREELICRCDAVYILRHNTDQKLSEAVSSDIVYALKADMPVYMHDQVSTNVPLSVTESKCPQQTKAFMEVVMKMYRVHLKKNADYSPANILGTGTLGVIVRMWDKMARIMNLSGFNLKLESTVEFNPALARIAENEPLEDSFWDMAVYSIIRILVGRDKWGK